MEGGSARTAAKARGNDASWRLQFPGIIPGASSTNQTVFIVFGGGLRATRRRWSIQRPGMFGRPIRAREDASWARVGAHPVAVGSSWGVGSATRVEVRPTRTTVNESDDTDGYITSLMAPTTHHDLLMDGGGSGIGATRLRGTTRSRRQTEGARQSPNWRSTNRDTPARACR